jgi:L-2-aminoadipate reductase
MIDPAYPFDRIQACLEIAQIKGWVAIEAAGAPPAELQAFLTSLGLLLSLTLPDIEDFSHDLYNPKLLGGSGKYSDSYPNVECIASDLAVVTFTSGSTGLPKGVMGRHASLTAFYPWMSQRYFFFSFLFLFFSRLHSYIYLFVCLDSD